MNINQMNLCIDVRCALNIILIKMSKAKKTLCEGFGKEVEAKLQHP